MMPAIDANALRDSIRAAAHWKVTIVPETHVAGRLPTLAEAFRVIEAANVQLRGWDYPHVDHQTRSLGQDFVQSWVEFMGERSFWRFYQSGLFVHVFAFREDSYGAETVARVWDRVRAPNNFQPRGFVDFLNALYTLTEILEFTSRLAERGALGGAFKLTISMENIGDRILVASDFRRHWTHFNPATEPRIEYSWEGAATDLAANARGIARSAANHFYERFGWLDASAAILVEEQSTLLEARLGTRR